MGYFAYNTLLTLVLLLTLPFLPFLFLLGERFRHGLGQRLGFYAQELKHALRGARPIWIHGASVGEIVSAGNLTQELKRRFPEKKIVVSAFTASGRKIAPKATFGDVFMSLPLDHPWMVRRAVAAIDPCVLIVLETEIWPNLLKIAHKKGIPTIILSGRISPRAFRNYSLCRRFFRRVIDQITAGGVQTREDANRFAQIGLARGKIAVTGSLKQAFADERCDASNALASNHLRREEGASILVAGSTHRGEEEIILDAFLSVKKSFPSLRLVLAPRHPERFPEVERLLVARGVSFAKKSETNGNVLALTDVLLLDTIGDLLGYYETGDLAFVGGSLVDAGGHNVLEPARFRKPILFGPFMTNFAEMTAQMKLAGGGVEVKGKDDLIREISDLLANRERRSALGDRAFGVAQGDGGVLDRSLGLILRYL